MAATKKEQDFARQVYGGTVEEIIDEYSELLIQYRAYVVREVGKSLRNELRDTAPPAYIELAERIVNKEQEQLLERELHKAKSATTDILRNQLDALRNQHFARENFDKQYEASISINDETQKKHLLTMQEYLKTKLEYQFALKKAESIKKMGPALQQHYALMHDLAGKVQDKEVKVLPKAENNEKPTGGRKERGSSISSENSVTPGEYGKQAKDVKTITDKLFEAGLGEYEVLEENSEDGEDK